VVKSSVRSPLHTGVLRSFVAPQQARGVHTGHQPPLLSALGPFLGKPQCPVRAIEHHCVALYFGTIECRPGRRSWRFCGTIFPCGSSSCSPRPSWAECGTGRRRVTILRSVTSFAACMPTIAPGALFNVMAGACTGCAPARALHHRPARRITIDKTAAKPPPRLWSRLRLRPRRWPRLRRGLRLRCRLSSANAQHRRRSNSDDPRHATSPPATSTSQPIGSARPRHHTPALRCHLSSPAFRRQPAPGTTQSALQPRRRYGRPTRAATTARRRSHRILTDPRRNRHHPRHHAEQAAMPRTVSPRQDHHDTVIDKLGKWWQATQSTPIRTR
jgi:hypothetical protein